MPAFMRKYNTLLVTGTTAIRIPIIKRAVVDFAVGADWTPAAGDVKIAIDAAAVANVTNLPTAIASGNGAYWEFILTAAELSGKQMIITIVDAATKAIEDQAFLVETYGNASAMYVADLSLANLPANVTQLLGTAWLAPGTAGTPDVNTKLVGGGTVPSGAIPNAVAGAAGGVFIAGTNAATAVTTALTANVTGNLSGSVGSVGTGGIAAASFAAGAIDAAAIAANAIDASSLAADAIAEIADGVWDEAIVGHLAAGSTGLALNSAGSAGDPWSTAVPGAYGAGTAGSKLGRVPDIAAGGAGGLFIAGTNAATAVTTALTANITGNLSGSVGSVASGGIAAASFVAGAIDAAAIAANAIGASELAADAVTEIQSGLALASDLAAVAGYLDTEILAIKAKTDLLPGSPAAVGSAMTLGADAVSASALATDAVAEITAAIKALVVETAGSYTLGQVLSILLAACSGVTADLGATLKTPNGATTRIAATVNASNERTAMTLTPSA